MNMIKLFALLSSSILVLLIPIAIFAQSKTTPIVLDMQNAPILPKHFRTTANLTGTKDNHWQDYQDLHMAGGGQFSKSSLLKILKYLHTKDLIVIDLRQESHGFLNGNAISWYGYRASENGGKSNSAIDADQTWRLNAIREDASVFVQKRNEKSNVGKTKPIEFAVHDVSSEEEFVNSLHLSYYRIYAQDFHAPTADQVDRFLELVKELPKHQWLYFHCRAGVGRTSTFMVMYDMVHNAKNISFENILQRQVSIGGKNLTKLPATNSFKYKYAKERLAFLRSFYEYAKQNNDAFKTSYTMWLKS